MNCVDVRLDSGVHMRMYRKNRKSFPCTYERGNNTKTGTVFENNIDMSIFL